MSSDKLQAVHEALANVFNQSNLNAAGTASSHTALDHETLAKAFSESDPKAANTEHSFARFDYEALTGIFSETPTDRPSSTSFDPDFSDVLSERSPLSSHPRPPRPGFDDQAFADLLSDPPPVSTNTRQQQPSFDHQALAEMLAELSADPIGPQMSSHGYDTDPSSEPAPGQIDREEPKAKAFAAAPPTNAESARQPPRARSLLTRLHHLFSTKEEALPSDVATEPLAPSGSGLPHTPEPIARAISTTDEDKLSLPADALADLPSVNFEQEHKSPHLVGQPAGAKPVPSVAAIAPPADTASAWPLQATSLPSELSIPISTERDSSPPAIERETSNLTVAGRLSNVDQAVAVGAPAEANNARRPEKIVPAAESAGSQTEPSPQTLARTVEHTASAASTVAHSALTHAESMPPQRLSSLLAEIAITISSKPKPPLAISEEEPSRATPSTQLVNLEPAANGASFPLTNSESGAMQPRQPQLLQSEILSPDLASTKPQPFILEMHSSPTIQSRHPKHAAPAAELFAAAPLSDAEAARPQQDKLLLADLPPSRSSLEKKASPAIFTGELDKVDPAVETVAATAQAHAVTAQEHTSLPLTGLPARVSADTKSSFPNFEQDLPSRLLSRQSESVVPPVNSVSVAQPTTAEDDLPQHASSLLTALRVLNEKPSPPLFYEEPFRSELVSQPDDPVMPVETIAHSTDAESGLSKQTKLLQTEMPVLACTDAKPSAPIFEKEPPSHASASYQPTDVALTARAASDAAATDWESAVTRAEQAKSLLAELDLNTAIHLRWVMRDIRSKRTKFSPVSANDLTMLMELGLVEMREEMPRLTGLGVLTLD